MKKRTTNDQKLEIVKRYLAGENATDIAPSYSISTVAVLGLLHRRNIKIRSQSQIQRKYQIDESFFDNIDTQEKAYFLGFLYADGYNNTDRYSVNLSLKESDKEILIKLNSLIQPTKPLQFVSMKSDRDNGINASDQYRLVIANKHISIRLNELGCIKAKTYILQFPKWLTLNLIPHFIRGYFDGDGWVSANMKAPAISIVSTKSFCERLALYLKNKLGINTYIRTRHKERNNNIRMLEVSGRNQVKLFLNLIYKNTTICMKRKKEISDSVLKYTIHKLISYCKIDGCDRKYKRKGYCQKHFYQYGGGKDERHRRYIITGK